MSESDPFASPYHQVNVPGQPNAPMPPGSGWPAPMPPVDARDLSVPRPLTMTVSFWCWMAGTLLVVVVLPGLFYTAVDVLTADLLSDAAAENEPLTTNGAELIARLMPAFFAAGFAIAAVPFVLCAVKARSGRNWARVVLTVLGALGILFGLIMLIAFTSDQLPVHWVLGAAWTFVFLTACVLGIVAMYLPASNAYVRSVTR